MTTTKYYALWIYHCFGDRVANAISEYPETLMELHEENIKNPYSYYHNYKDKIEEITVELIDCYTYNSITKTIEPYTESDIAEDHAFYALSNLPIIKNNKININENKYDDEYQNEECEYKNNNEENDTDVLIYLSKTIHTIWQHHSDLYNKIDNKNTVVMDPELPTFFYTEWTSYSPVEPDVYYEESIMNA